MIWNSWQDFFSMGGHAVHVWGSVVAVVTAFACEIVGLRLRMTAALRSIATTPNRRGEHS